jgi:hypothetical protein
MLPTVRQVTVTEAEFAMTNQKGARFQYCDQVGMAVCIDGTEGQCRDRHQCSLYRCPLEGKFADDRPTVGLQGLVASWCGGLLASLRREQ